MLSTGSPLLSWDRTQTNSSPTSINMPPKVSQTEKARSKLEDYEERMEKADFAAQGLPMTRAGPPPLLTDVLLPGETRESADGPTTAKDVLQRKERVHCGSSESTDSLLGEDFDPDSDDKSEVWSAHDESDPE